jgi:hypothetical protein
VLNDAGMPNAAISTRQGLKASIQEQVRLLLDAKDKRSAELIGYKLDFLLKIYFSSSNACL